MRVDISSLPSKLPDTETIDTQAAAVRKVGTDSVDIRDDVQGHWAGLGAVFESPHQDKVFSAVETVMSPYIDDVGTTTGSAADALENFSLAISGMKSRYDTIKEQAASHNSLGDSYLPEDYADIGISLQEEVAAVRKLYDDAVKECADAISKLNPLISDSVSNGISDASLVYLGGKLTKDGVLVFGVTQSLRGKNTGPLNYYLDTGDSEIRKGSAPGEYDITRKDHDKTHRSRGLPRLPSNYDELETKTDKDNKHRSPGPARQPRIHPALHTGPDNTHRLPGRAAFGTAFPASLASLVGADGKLKNTHKKSMPKAPEVKAELTRNTNPHRADGPARLPKALDKVDKLAKGPAGKALPIVGAGLTFAGAATDGYNASVTRNPEMTTAEHIDVAATDAAVVTAAETGGEIVGTAVGRGAGALIGQAVIPIPGVGAAVGGLVGGLLGGYVGGEVGNALGSTFNDLRHRDIDLGDAAGAAKDHVVDSLKEKVDSGKRIFGALNPFD